MPQTPPRFSQIVEILRSDIQAEHLAPHAALPSERALAEKYDVSRMTARRALAALEAQGLAYSEDRKGRFVSPRRVQYDLSDRVSFAADAQAKGEHLKIELIEKNTIVADQTLSAKLNISVGEALYQYTRAFSMAGHQVLIETEIVIARRCPALLDYDLCQSTTKLIEKEYKIFASAGEIMIKMRALDSQEAALLGLTPHQAGIELEQVIHDQSGQPFCFGRQIWRGELAQFSAKAILNR